MHLLGKMLAGLVSTKPNFFLGSLVYLKKPFYLGGTFFYSDAFFKLHIAFFFWLPMVAFFVSVLTSIFYL